MSTLNSDIPIQPDEGILRELKDIGFDNFDDLIAYAGDQEDVYCLALFVPIPKLPKDVMATIDFLFMCTKPTGGKPGKLECVDGRILRIEESGELAVCAGLTQWSENGPFLSKSAIIEKLLYMERHKVAES